MNWRIVYNEQTKRYRIQCKRWWGFDFVLNPTTGAYLSFADCEAARNWACRNLKRNDQRQRRWRVMSACEDSLQ